MRTIIYARYSSQLQDKRSIEDQVRVCRERAEAEGWEIVDVFSDYEISGKVFARPGLQAMLERVVRGDVDQVMAEALDRIARSQVDTPLIHQKIQFAGARLFTLSQGIVTELHTAFQGAMDALQLKELAAKVRRGQRGRAAAGRGTGGVAYGYRIVRRFGPNGEIEKGLREVDEDQAEIVRRIFREFLAGTSPRAIAAQLNREKVPSPSGGLWRVSTINGDRIRKNGILQNELYAGRIVYNKTRRDYDPETRKRVIRSNPPSEWQVTAAPDLQIVSDADWAAIEQHRDRIEGVPFHRQKRPKRLLSGLGRCGTCDGPWVIVGRERWGCAGHRDATGCGNGRTITNAEYERRVLAGLHDQMLDPEAVAIYVQEYRRQFAELSRGRAAERRRSQKRLEESEGKVTRLVAAIAQGGGEFPEIRAALAEARRDREEAAAELAALDDNSVVDLHPRLADQYRKEFAELTDALGQRPDSRSDIAAALRSLVDAIVV